jgi:hypothetical protein
MAKHKRIITGDCGELYAASLLAGLGADVRVERVNQKAKDLNVRFGRKSFTVQVKAGRLHTNEARKRRPEKSRWVWRTGKKCIGICSRRHRYAFVYLGDWPTDGVPPEVFFIPSRVVARRLLENEEGQQDWFCIPKDDAEKFRGLKGIKTMRSAISKLKIEAQE